MAKYSDIKGFTVQTLSTDTVADQAAGGAWASGGAMPAAKWLAQAAGTQTSNLQAGGASDAPAGPNKSDASFEYNGTSWTAGGDMNTGRYAGSGLGASNGAAVVAGGNEPSIGGKTETYNGTAFTEANDLNTSRGEVFGGGGTSTAGVVFGGGTPVKNETETWDGSSWTETGNLNTARMQLAGAGAAYTASIAFGGYTTTGTGATETFNGSSWTETGDLNTAREGLAGSGTSTAALAFSGLTPAPAKVGVTENFDGSTWTEVADLSTTRYLVGGSPSGTNELALAAGGLVTEAVTTTEEWSAPVEFNQIQEGQLFYNSTTNAFKETITDIPGGTWASNANMNNARDNTSGTGHTKDAVMIMAGRGPSSNIGNCEQYNGSTWTEVADVTSRRMSAASGTSTAALQFGGTTSYPSSPPGQSALTESFNGSTWTEVGDLNTARWRVSGSPSGTSTAALATGGREPSYSAKTEVYDGSTWTEVGDLNAAKAGATNIGTSTANIFAGGETAPGADTVNTESWDGTSWTEVNNLPAAAKENGGTGGTSTLGFLAGVGGGAAPTSECDFWNGTSWSEMAELGSGRPAGGGGGTAVGATIAGGNPFTAVSESFTAPLANKTITST